MMKKIVGVVAIGVLVLALGSGVLADSFQMSKARQNERAMNGEFKRGMGAERENGKDKIEKLVNELVEEGNLSEDKGDSILSFIEDKKAEMEAHMEEMKDMTPEERREFIEKNREERPQGGIIEEMVDEGIITEEDGDLIRDKNEENMRELKQTQINNSLSPLVEEGIISQDVIDRFIELDEERHEERKAKFGKMRDMTKEERRDFLKENRGNRVSIIDQMVEEGTITEDQADAIRESLPRPRDGRGGRMMKKRGLKMVKE